MSKVIFWFRRDLRFDDNTGLLAALAQNNDVLPLFIFDEQIVNELSPDDPRVGFIYKSLKVLDDKLKKYGSGRWVMKGNPLEVWKEILTKEKISKVYSNKDYEPYARERDHMVKEMLGKASVGFDQFKDQVIFEEVEIVKDNQEPYHVRPIFYHQDWRGVFYYQFQIFL